MSGVYRYLVSANSDLHDETMLEKRCRGGCGTEHSREFRSQLEHDHSACAAPPFFNWTEMRGSDAPGAGDIVKDRN
jgi:hypothetical protein